jgi:hypothetical protein
MCYSNCLCDTRENIATMHITIETKNRIIHTKNTCVHVHYEINCFKNVMFVVRGIYSYIDIIL